MYRVLFSLVLRRFPPEAAHHGAFALIRLVAAIRPLAAVIQRLTAPPAAAAVEVFGRTVRGPMGVAAGFDKEARCVNGLVMLGFGYVEIGTVTAVGQPGNEQPRLWRVTDQHALRNRMGFNNDGSAAVAERLRRLRATQRGKAAVIGVNIGKNKLTAPEQAPVDYATCATRLAPYADYLVVNVSSPNTPGLRDLQAVSSLRPILVATRTAAADATARAGRPPVPLLVKIAPDLSDDDVDAVADLVLELGLDGVVAVNTTINHDLGPGGLSGPPLLSRGLDVVARLRGRLGPDPVIIGAGGITAPADAQEYLAVGATLVQGYTGFIYEGPFWGSRINRSLAAAV